MTFDYYKAKYEVVTARRAQLMGLKPRINYGYYVLCSPRPPESSTPTIEADVGIVAWRKSKPLADQDIEDRERSKKLGYYGCNCGSNKQARACCGIPQ